MLESFFIDSHRLACFVENIEKRLVLENKTIQDISYIFRKEMEKGLAGEESSLAMLPAHISRAQLCEKEERYPLYYLAIDLGGTNVRALKVCLESPKSKPKILFHLESEIRRNIITSSKGEDLFDFVAGKLKSLLLESGDWNSGRSFVLGLTFSFSFEQNTMNSGRILSLSKGFCAKDLVHKDPVKLLESSLKKYDICNVRVGAILNDATGTFLTGMRHPDCDGGVILGTGFNICVDMPIQFIVKKTHPFFGKKMVVVQESGNFDMTKVGISTEFDREVDLFSENPGKHLAEKMMSGKYLGGIFYFMIESFSILQEARFPFKKDRFFSTKCLSEIEEASSFGSKERINDLFRRHHLNIQVSSHKDSQQIRKLCSLISTRSANLLVAFVLGSIQMMDSKLLNNHMLAIDGSIYKKYFGFKKRVCDSLEAFSKGKISMREVEDGSGIGAALAAAVSDMRE